MIRKNIRRVRARKVFGGSDFRNAARLSLSEFGVEVPHHRLSRVTAHPLVIVPLKENPAETFVSGRAARQSEL
jgi:hypothetical protein